ncbi:MAG: aldo/keto reductase [Eubacteriaceae bacterium]|nr:aldo/keto reductase [Eubacteriaceae bacterium]
MEYHDLGKTGIRVSRLCFGSLTVAPMQKNLSLKKSREIMAAALDAGVNFFDTADLYNNYAHLRQVLEMKPDAVICTKSYDYSAEGVAKSLNKALKQLGRDYIDIYMLHEQENRLTFKGHWEAIEYLMKMKKKGVIRAFGISTHRVEGVTDSCDFPEIEVVFPIVNRTGIGIEDGGREEMEDALSEAKKAGKGIMGMKPLGGGNLLSQVDACFDYVLGLPQLDSIALGMQSVEEVCYNTARFEGRPIDAALAQKVAQLPRRLHISDWCEGCGRCVARCGQHALSLVDGKAQVDYSRCLTCCYCATVCPMFCIKVI